MAARFAQGPSRAPCTAAAYPHKFSAMPFHILGGSCKMPPMATRTTDYTRFPIGTKEGDGEIQECPVCHRRALVEKSGKKIFYTHTQTVGVNEQRQAVVTWQQCSQEITPE